ncbi:MAG: ACT domain-containing protein [Sulfurovum sp.]|nr:ACT domain-containing protein [Sulfurovum sp.]
MRHLYTSGVSYRYALNESFVIHRLAPDSKIPDTVYSGKFFTISKSENELSIVCSSSIVLESQQSEDGWSCVRVVGELDFSMVGILAKISSLLAGVGVSIFVISTYDTDYILIKSDQLAIALNTLEAANYIIKRI